MPRNIKHLYLRLLFLVIMVFFVPTNSLNAAYKYPMLPSPNIPAIRKLLVSAIDSKKTTDSLYNRLDAVKDRQPLINGYMGTLEALKAKHAWNPYYKIKYLNDSENTFRSAIVNDPHNIEIRFMRFSVEHNVPGFLGYNKNLLSDREEIIRQVDKKYYASADNSLVKTIILFLLESRRCTPAENTILNQNLAGL